MIDRETKGREYGNEARDRVVRRIKERRMKKEVEGVEAEARRKRKEEKRNMEGKKKVRKIKRNAKEVNVGRDRG